MTNETLLDTATQVLYNHMMLHIKDTTLWSDVAQTDKDSLKLFVADYLNCMNQLGYCFKKNN